MKLSEGLVKLSEWWLDGGVGAKLAKLTIRLYMVFKTMTGMTILNYAKWCFSAELAICIIAKCTCQYV